MKSELDIIITTFKRNDRLKNLISSIPKKYHSRVIIGDQNRPEEREKIAGIRTIELPYDCGLSYARNELIRATRAPFVLLLEDDFEFTKETRIDKLIALMKLSPKVGVVGGAVEQNNVRIPFEFYPEVKDGILYHSPDGERWVQKEDLGLRYKLTGCVMNFALFRQEVFQDILWDPELKLREHQDFYLRLNQDTDWIVLFTDGVAIKDAKTRPTPEYKALKDRDEFYVKMLEKHGLYKIKYQNGSTRTLVNGKIVKSKEPPLH